MKLISYIFLPFAILLCFLGMIPAALYTAFLEGKDIVSGWLNTNKNG